MNKVFVIVGMTGSGKTSALYSITDEFNSVDRIVTRTTRKQRDEEIDGHDYHFVDDYYFENFSLICVEEYNIVDQGPQKYGVLLTDIAHLSRNKAIVLTPKGYKELKAMFGDKVVGIYIAAKKEKLKENYLKRDKSNPNKEAEFERRYVADLGMFDEIMFDIKYTVLNIGTLEDLEKKVQNIVMWEMNN